MTLYNEDRTRAAIPKGKTQRVRADGWDVNLTLSSRLSVKCCNDSTAHLERLLFFLSRAWGEMLKRRDESGSSRAAVGAGAAWHHTAWASHGASHHQVGALAPRVLLSRCSELVPLPTLHAQPGQFLALLPRPPPLCPCLSQSCWLPWTAQLASAQSRI